jgi:branched-chain amino acid aminotransferase
MNDSSIFLYGKGVFTTIAIIGGKPFRFASHWSRLTANAAHISLDVIGFQESQVLDELRRRLEAAGLASGRARITLADESTSSIWYGTPAGQTTLSIIAAERRAPPPELKLSKSPFPVNSRSPLAGIKSCNYLEQILSLDEAKDRGFHEAIRVNEQGFVTSACMANVFWLKDGRLFTPSLETGCLAGTTREFVLENLECSEVEAEIGEVDGAEAVFLTSAGLGIARVAEFDGRALADVSHPILNLWPR